jgi:replicative DNA helicase
MAKQVAKERAVYLRAAYLILCVSFMRVFLLGEKFQSVYLQLLAPHDTRSTDKQNTDKAVLKLKQISRDYKIAVLAISSFNRENYANAVSLIAFKESGATEYSSDVLIGLQAKDAGEKNFDVDAAKQREPREVELKILKNQNGPTGGVIEYRYYPRFNHFEEVGFYTR